MASTPSCRTRHWPSIRRFLYAGYVGLSIAFSFAVAALIEGRVDAAWARWVRPWTLAAWMFLTIGIAMGSWWAYYELGWGGWWFWDPVENASFMPWLVATALLHSAIVVEKRNALKIWTVLLSIFAFSLSLIGTFLVRSGVLTSVHAFAVDPERGLFILLILMPVHRRGADAVRMARAEAEGRRAVRAGEPGRGPRPQQPAALRRLPSRSSSARFIPLALETLTNEKISVGPPYFNLTFGPIILPLLLAGSGWPVPRLEARRHRNRACAGCGSPGHWRWRLD
jgi:cytochrome c-type biogenesis protein CcmF